jgi:hypothetical protein
MMANTGKQQKLKKKKQVSTFQNLSTFVTTIEANKLERLSPESLFSLA